MNVIIAHKKMIKLKAAKTKAEWSKINALSHEIWHEYYPAIVTTEQIDYMLEKYHSIEALQKQSEEGQQFFLIENEEEEIGYCSISEKNKAVFLHKFYILKSKRGKGIGTEVFRQILEFVKKNKKISLQVNRKNFKSINFYFKQGFTIEYVKDFEIGNGYLMEDFIMTKTLNYL